MQVDAREAAGKSEYNGKTYYFCALSCRAEFDQNPTKYAKNSVAARKRRKRGGGRRRLRLSPWLIATPVVAIGVAILAALVLTSGSSGTTGPAREVAPDARVAGQASTASFSIDVDDVSFSPSTISAKAGDVIELVITNTGTISHNLRVSGPDRKYGNSDDFESEPFAIGPGETGRAVVKIESRGTYPFRCDFHPAAETGTLVLA
jgi:YHS domain-containing protein/plastocyanin